MTVAAPGFFGRRLGEAVVLGFGVVTRTRRAGSCRIEAEAWFGGESPDRLPR